MGPFLLLMLMFLLRSGVESRMSARPISVALLKQKDRPKTHPSYKALYFPQVIDHFNFEPQSSNVFFQKYLMNQDYWHKGAQIFVYTGNEGDIGWFAQNTGFLLDIAPKFHALLVFIEMCKIIDKYAPGASKLTRAIAAAGLYYNYSGCFDLEDETDIQGLRGWDWQSCTEMVQPMSYSNQSMFPPYQYNYTAFKELCKTLYGVTPRPHQITTQYGGIGIDKVLKRSGSNIIFSNGMQDPWSRGSVLKNISASIVALVTEKGAHHLDFRHETKQDPGWLIKQRKQEVEIIKKWIDEYYLDYKQE